MDKRDDDAELVEGIEPNKAFNISWAENCVDIAASESEFTVEVSGERLNVVNKLLAFHAQIHMLNSVVIAILFGGFEIEFIAIHISGFTHRVISGTDHVFFTPYFLCFCTGKPILLQSVIFLAYNNGNKKKLRNI